jgi:DNA polymerase III subunit delta'
MRFQDIAGKNSVKTQLTNQVTRSRIPHAQIFLGREGAGGLPLAMAYASYIMCKNRSENDSCGECDACRKSAKYIHPDIHFAYPVVAFQKLKREQVTSEQWLPDFRKALVTNPYMDIGAWLNIMDAEDKQPNINVKECNDIRHKLSLMTYEADVKIMIIWLPEYLEKEGNRLLKLIEEPTDNTYIILIAENQDRILKTILSRCQLLRIPSFSAEEIQSYLVEKFDAHIQQAEQISNLVQGNLNQAIAICSGEEFDFSDKLIEWFRYAYTGDPIKINEWVRNISELSKDDQKNFLYYGLHFFRQFIFKLLTNGKVALTQKELETANKMTSIIDVDKAEKICAVINDGIYLLQRNANPKIMLFADTLTIGRILKPR